MMKTKKREELIEAFLPSPGEEIRPVCRELTAYLAGLGCYPRKEKSGVSFKRDPRNKQMAKTGFGRGKTPAPFFALRFSACRGYSQRFSDIVGGAVVRYPSRAARCTDGGCDFCAGDPETHVCIGMSPDGETKSLCAANASAIPVSQPMRSGIASV